MVSELSGVVLAQHAPTKQTLRTGRLSMSEQGQGHLADGEKLRPSGERAHPRTRLGHTMALDGLCEQCQAMGRTAIPQAMAGPFLELPRCRCPSITALPEGP